MISDRQANLACRSSTNDNDSVTSAPGCGATAIWNSRVVGAVISTSSSAPTARFIATRFSDSGEQVLAVRGTAHLYPRPSPGETSGKPCSAGGDQRADRLVDLVGVGRAAAPAPGYAMPAAMIADLEVPQRHVEVPVVQSCPAASE